ncbi:EAL domain-containing protein [Bradyrhizobium genosp. L]|uniref:bifunctional diguanylate cyclase/phosphodiesterase n=1 Tax=Bradyrhizobium genosp. L TaxID=83637 RepID=UPI0018A25DEF|nr:EAL domain-containing protein [Bradyrhizobium genosp. L]QPF85247.1 EAL domain-containing protein [Bradyrhizobium genosp. L]
MQGQVGVLSGEASSWRRIASTIRGPVLWLTVCGALLVAAIFVGTTMMIGEFRERALANSERELENTVLLLARHFDQQFEDSDTIASNMIDKLQISSITSPEQFRARMSTPEVHQMLKAKGVSFLGHLVLFDADGKAIVWSADSTPPAKLNIAERDYFKSFKYDAHPEPVRAETLRSLIVGGLSTVIAHRLTGPDGSFLGVMTRRIDPLNYEKFFASVAPGTSAAIAMFHTDGTMLARYPHVDEMIGRKLSKAPLVDQVARQGGQRTQRLASPIDGIDRLGSAVRLTHFPAVVVATNSIDAALADWRAQTRFLISAATLAATIVALVLFVLIRQIWRQNREAQLRLESERQRLDTALNNMMQGLVLFDASARMVVCNQRYLDMCRLSAEHIKPGCSFEDVMRQRNTAGTFDGDDVEAFCATVRTSIAAGKPVDVITATADGRYLSAVSQPLAHGGWVATIDDITERLNLERERDRNNAFLREIVDHIPSQITVKDAHTRRYLLVNRVAETHFGTARDNIIGKTPHDLFPSDAAEVIAADDEIALQSTGGLFKDEHLWHSHVTGDHYITSRRIGIRDHAGTPRYIITVVDDVTERRRANERIAHLAHYDALTDLPNRVLFREQIERELSRARQGRPFALLYIDIDEFKGINDSLGHHVGDELLKTVAGRIKACLSEGDLIARLGGDEFAVIQSSIGSAADVEAFVASVHRAIREPCDCLGHHLSTDASIGVALAPQDGTELDQLIRNADIAMYAAKAEGRRTHRFFEPEMGAHARARLTMEQDLRQAMNDGGFEIHYQPLLDLASGEVTCCEALLRWRHAKRGMISPVEFIPVAEDTGLIGELGEWVLRTACMEAASWPDHIRLAVNVSPIQLKNISLALKVASALAASGLKPDRLELEITEAVLIGDDEVALAILHQLRAIGVRIALDDFGTGYSSLSYLKRFPFDKIKIDRSFVSDIAVDGSATIVQSVVNIATSRNMTTVAEGVETEQQRNLLRELGCTEMQGYLFSPPKPAAELRRLLGARDKRTRARA